MPVNTYKVTAVTPYGYPVHPQKGSASEQVKGSAEISAAKAKIRQRLQKKRQKFDVYNVTRKRFVNY